MYDISRAAVLTRAHVWEGCMRKGRVGEGAAVANTDIKNRDLSMRLALKILQEEVAVVIEMERTRNGDLP